MNSGRARVQILGNIKEFSDLDSTYAVHPYSELEAFDAYDLTIIDFQDSNIWRNQKRSTQSINESNDLRSITTAMDRSQNCKIAVLYPQNYVFQYEWEYISNGKYGYKKKCSLKDMLVNVKDDILYNFFPEYVNLVFGKSVTKIDDIDFLSDFHIDSGTNQRLRTLCCSEAKGATVVALDDAHFFTTLDINANNLESFVKMILGKEEEAELPWWLDEITYLDEMELRQDLERKIALKQQVLEDISSLQANLESYKDVKSIVCIKDRALELKIRSMLQEMLGDESDYEDTKKEDYSISHEEVEYIFEIKGATGGLKRQHLSRTNDHVQIKLDSFEEAGLEKKVKGVLIFSDNIEKNPQERDKYPETQVKLADRDELLVIPTTAFLRIYEDYKRGEMDTNKFFDLIDKHTGLLNYPPIKSDGSV